MEYGNIWFVLLVINSWGIVKGWPGPSFLALPHVAYRATDHAANFKATETPVSLRCPKASMLVN